MLVVVRVGRPAAAFRVFLNAEVINIVLRSTNEEGRRISGDDWHEVTMDELYVFLGLLILAGVYHAKNESAS